MPTATFEELAARRPQDIDEAVRDLGALLGHFHREGDGRAVFLRAHYFVTVNLHAAVNGRPRKFFFDPQWVSKLAGKFASLYLESLDGRIQLQIPAWKAAHAHAAKRDLSVAQDLLLGLNAHLNFDQPWGIYLNLVEHGDHKDHAELPRRKFDHDQMNNVFAASLPQLQQALSRDYGELGPLDDLLSRYALKHYRERVWWNAVTYISGRTEDELALMRAKLNFEAQLLANELTAERSSLQRAVGAVLSRVRRKRWGELELEQTGGTPPLMSAAVSPY